MEIKNRLFPYPVLCADLDDYVTGSFDAQLVLDETVNDLVLRFTISLDSTELLDLVRMGKAQYVIHLECSNTAYRKVIKTNINEINHNIPKSKINKELSVVVMVVATTEITNYFSSSLNEDYLGEQIDFEYASILAYKNLPKVLISKEYEELAGNETLFSLIRMEYPDPEEEHLIDVLLNDDRIKIQVDSRTYDTYLKYQQSTALTSVMFVLPAILHMIDVIREEGSVDSFEDKRWFIKMKLHYKSQGKDLIDELLGESRKSALEMAQEMLKLPIGRAYKEISEIGG